MEFEAYIDEWDGNRDQGGAIAINTDNAAYYIQLLDAKIHSQILVVAMDKRSSLLIGGGAGTYVVTLTEGSDEVFYHVVDVNKGEREIELVTGGQAGLFQEKFCVDFVTTLNVLRFYLINGDRHPAVEWEKQ